MSKKKKIDMPICCYCKRPYDSTSKNYGFHQNARGVIERCVFPGFFSTIPAVYGKSLVRTRIVGLTEPPIYSRVNMKKYKRMIKKLGNIKK